MDILDRLLGHDAWTTRQLLLRCRDLTDEQLDRDFDIGHRTLRATFVHIIANMDCWSALIAGRQFDRSPYRDPQVRSITGLIDRLDIVAPQRAAAAQRLAREGRLDEKFTDHLDDPPTQKSHGGAIAHVLTHSMHHRAQVLYLMRRLGVTDLIEGDVLSWENDVREAEQRA
jgi:uncharacterized damage-inducible protein DinB